MLDLALDLSRGRVLRPMEDRIPMEARRGGQLSRSEALYDSNELRALRDVAFESDTQTRTGQHRARRQAAHLEVMREGVATLNAQFQQSNRRGAFERFQADPGLVTDDWVETQIDALRSWMGLQLSSAPPKPRRVPSLWRYVAHRVANIYHVHTGRVQPDRNDEYDARIYADTAYASVLVTNDGGFRSTVALTPTPRADTPTLQDWVHRLSC